MIVRNLKCPQCGGIKMNELTTGYIYCDFCSALMGYDMKNIHDEAGDVFSPENMSKPLQTKYISLVQKMASALNEENVDDYVELQIQIKEIEFDLFPKRFSPKAKQKAYRRKYLEFTEAMWIENIGNGYFKKSRDFREKINPLTGKLKSHIENGKMIYEYNSDFEEYLMALDEYLKNSVKESMEMKCMEVYPEPVNPSFDVLYKQSFDASLQMFDSDTVSKALKFLKLEDEYITIVNVNMNVSECFVCKSKLKIPEGSIAIVCETCGNINDFEKQKIQCISCGASVAIHDSNACEFCGAVHMSFSYNSESSKSSEQIQKTIYKKKGGSFFGRLFK